MKLLVFFASLMGAVSAQGTTSNIFNTTGPSGWYVNPSYKTLLETSIATATGTVKTTLENMRNVPSAYWIDVKAKLTGNTTDTLEGILADSASKATPQLVVLMVYDLPNRDCHAKASNGEICCTYLSDGRCDYLAGGTCAEGLAEYKTEYIDRFAEIVGRYAATVPMALIIEPDSLPNLSTNLDNPNCGNTATQAAYKEGITYAVQTLAAAAPQAALYLDAAHGGWLGWDDNLVDFVQLLSTMGITSYLRGMALNVANYQPLGTSFAPWVTEQYGGSETRNDYCLPTNNNGADAACYDPCNLSGEYNPGNTELNYAMSLKRTLAKYIPGFTPHMIIDTGRNGVDNMRADCANWCNARGAGVGRLPTVATADTSFIDAYYWLKTPGESDGCSEILPDGNACPRFDEFCASADSLGSAAGEPRVPEAGQWFDYQIKQLAANERMGGIWEPVEPEEPEEPEEPTFPDCPGGDLAACIAVCPANPIEAYQICVNTCVDRCS